MFVFIYMCDWDIQDIQWRYRLISIVSIHNGDHLCYHYHLDALWTERLTEFQNILLQLL